MAKARTEGLPQINGQLIYGSIPIELFPDGDDTLQMPVWHPATAQWYLATIVGGGGMDISFDQTNNTLEIFFANNRVYDTATADAILFKTTSTTFVADAVLV